MSPESYVLLLISCWLLLAAALLWGMLRIARRHYATNGLEDCEAETRSERPTMYAITTRPTRSRLGTASQFLPVPFANMVCAPGKTRG